MKYLNLSQYPWVQDLLKNIIGITQKNVLNLCSILVKMDLPAKNKKKCITTLTTNISIFYTNMINIVLWKDISIKMTYNDEGIFEGRRRVIQKRNLSEHPWVQDLMNDIVGTTRKEVLNWCSELVKTGLTHKKQKRWISAFTKEISTFYRYEIQDLMQHQDKLSIEIKELLQELKSLCKDFEIEMPIHNFKGLGLYKKRSLLKKSVQREIEKEITFERNWIQFQWEVLADPSLQAYEKENSLEILKTLRRETQRCELQQKADIEVSVKLLRRELVNMWDKCHFTNAERNFHYVRIDVYTESSRKLHIRELRKIKKYYEQNRELYNLLEKREELRLKYRKVEPRIIKKKKEILQIERQLLKLADDFQLRTGRAFLSWGQTMSDIIIFQGREKYVNEKKVNLSRKRKRDKTPSTSQSDAVKRWRTS